MWRHRRVGVLDVDVVAGAGAPPRGGRRATPTRVAQLLVGELAPGVLLVAGEHEHRAPHAPHLGLEHRDVELARDADAEHRVGLPHPAALHLAGAVAREVQRPLGGQPRVVAPAVRRPSPRPTPTAGAPTAAPGRCGRTTAGRRRGSGRAARAPAAGGPRPSMFTTQRTELRAHAPPRRRPDRRRRSGRRSPTGPPPRWRISSARSRWMQRPREPGVERAAVAVAAEVDRDDVVAERGEPRREAVEHPAVVVGAVQAAARAASAGSPQPHVRNVVRPRSTSSARSGSGIATADHGARVQPQLAPNVGADARGTDRSRRARWSGRPWAVVVVLLHDRADVDDALALLARDLRPVVRVGGVGQVLVLLVLLVDRLDEVGHLDALRAAAEEALDGELLGPAHDVLDHGSGREVLEVHDLLVAVLVRDLEELVAPRRCGTSRRRCVSIIACTALAGSPPPRSRDRRPRRAAGRW